MEARNAVHKNNLEAMSNMHMSFKETLKMADAVVKQIANSLSDRLFEVYVRLGAVFFCKRLLVAELYRHNDKVRISLPVQCGI